MVVAFISWAFGKFALALPGFNPATTVAPQGRYAHHIVNRTGGTVPVHLAELALSVARCPEVPLAASDSAHPCHKVVHSQDQYEGPFQVPEAWAGKLETAKVVFLSSNPAISAGVPDARASYKRQAEMYPTADWDDAHIADFMLNRFDSERGWVNERLQHLKVDGESRGAVEKYWTWVKQQTEALVGTGRPWYENVAMTEVVHCKSGSEEGVKEAADRCSSMHMNRVLAGSPANLVIVVGTQARDRFLRAYPEVAEQYPSFGRDNKLTGRVDPRQSIIEMHLGGWPRTVCFLWHNSAYAPKIKDLASMYPDDFPRLQAAALAGAA
ncbi:hypothetical protein GC088_09935 [Arthrobacter sp. JZ12]|uniref:hypothetical protein n=1 Tax=Arthrobacter sp. JZ12 TaxID=2654190 RepID=UPI002B45C5CA|nr:hypothetical protein [Arthrobacter sp. JZ12]WRH25349.1 hypothetical protein GC088_09935 [Arthrobacter sp. JZ12]